MRKNMLSKNLHVSHDIESMEFQHVRVHTFRVYIYIYMRLSVIVEIPRIRKKLVYSNKNLKFQN